MPHSYKYPRPALTVDCVVFGFDDADLKVLLIRRGEPPFAGEWALPGGFVRVEEALDEAARRELCEEAGLEKVYLEQLYSFGTPDRDPRERVVSVAYVGLVRRVDHVPVGATDAVEADWFSANRTPKLAFDHAEILAIARQRLRGKIRWEPIGFELLPPKFTLTQLQVLYEAILGEALDKRNFRKKILGQNILVALEEFDSEKSKRPARLYRFDHKQYRRLTQKGFVFDL